ncbi:MAG: Gfo/Idh/MocA family protein [bacterium]
MVGLAFSHPYSYTQILGRMGHTVSHVWDDDPSRLTEFATRFGAAPVSSPDAVPAGVDGVIVTGRLPERIDHALVFIDRGTPVYLGKPMVANAAQLSRVVEAVRRTGTPVLTTSVLRYAPAILSLRRHLDQGRLGTPVTAHCLSAHSIELYLKEPHVWQDDPTRGGGTLITMGVHALEMLSVLVGASIRAVSCHTGRRFYTRSLSEDVAVLTIEWTDGLLGTVDIVGGVSGEFYGIEMYGSDAVLRAAIPKGDVRDHRGAFLGDVDPWEEFGYTGTMTAFMDMCRTHETPVPLDESEAIMRTLLAARLSAISGQPVSPDTMRMGGR